MELTSQYRRFLTRSFPYLLISAIIVAALLILYLPGVGQQLNRAAARLPDFTTIFLGIFIEAAPFLLFGTLASGIVEVFFSQDFLLRLIPRRRLPGAVVGSLMGMFFPVCECGAVPLTRRLIRKGVPVSTGIAFLLAAPVLNPIVIASTAAAFGWGSMLALRMGSVLLIATVTGIVFSVEKSPWAILRPTEWINGDDAVPAEHIHEQQSLPDRWRRVLSIAMDEFFEMGRYLIIGSALAAAMQVFIPESILLSLGQGRLTSILAMVSIAVLLSVCSTVDAFIALGFVGTFSTGAILAFLVFGPMVDIKSILMYMRVYRTRAVLYLVLIPLFSSLLIGLLVNDYLP
jgi:uncharacterized protein